MKHTYFTLFFCLLSLLLGSCDKNVDDFYPPYNYNYYIAFVDESGKDLLEGISTTLSDTKLPILEKGTYSYVFIPPNSKDQFTFSGIIELENVKGHNALGIHLGMADWHLHKKPEVILIILLLLLFLEMTRCMSWSLIGNSIVCIRRLILFVLL